MNLGEELRELAKKNETYQYSLFCHNERCDVILLMGTASILFGTYLFKGGENNEQIFFCFGYDCFYLFL